jgi:DNA-binding beta-propeller fold protein YncE
VGGFLLGVRALPGGVHLLTTDGGYYDNYLTLVSAATGEIVQQEPFAYAEGRGLFLGLAQRDDGRLFASGGGSDAIFAFDYDAAAPAGTPPLTRQDEIDVAGGALVAGLAFADATHLVAAYQGISQVAILDTTNGAELHRFTVGESPYDVVVDRTRQEAYVSLWGEDAVAVVDLAAATPQVVARIAVGKNPSALLLYPAAAPTRLLVAATDSDRIDVVDLETRTRADSFSVAAAVDAPRGSSPNHLSVSPDGARLYVANAGENCIDVFATADFSRIGRLPTAWYPTAVAVGEGGTLYVASAKGLGGGPTTGTSIDYGILKGTLSVVPAPSLDDLTQGADQVEANNRRMRQAGARVTCPAAPEPCRYPLPPVAGLPTPIEHVVLIVRENKTYDANLGDLGNDADGDPSLVLFGEEYTPNLHALARAFSNGDNFYADAEASIQGHAATTSAHVNDFTEKTWLSTWGRHQRDVSNFGKRIATPEEGTYFQHLGRAGVSYIDYGELVGLAAGTPDDVPVVTDQQWPGGIIFNTSTRERDKADYYKTVLGYGEMPRFTYMILPNNHTEGLTPGKWTPEFMVADNDEATGLVVESIAHSPFWSSTVIFIIEDDPQDGADHVEVHRSTLVVVSPWVKRHYTSKVNYNVASLWATIELLVGLPPRSQVTADAAPMFDLFTTTPDEAVYDHIASNVPEAFNKRGVNPKLEAASERMDFSTVDNAPGLGRVLWEHMKGAPAPWATMPLPLDLDDEAHVPAPFRHAPPAPGAAVERRDADDADDD